MSLPIKVDKQTKHLKLMWYNKCYKHYLRMDRKDYKRNNFNPRIKWRKIEAYTIEKQTGFLGEI